VPVDPSGAFCLGCTAKFCELFPKNRTDTSAKPVRVIFDIIVCGFS